MRIVTQQRAPCLYVRADKALSLNAGFVCKNGQMVRCDRLEKRKNGGNCMQCKFKFVCNSHLKGTRMQIPVPCMRPLNTQAHKVASFQWTRKNRTVADWRFINVAQRIMFLPLFNLHTDEECIEDQIKHFKLNVWKIRFKPNKFGLDFHVL